MTVVNKEIRSEHIFADIIYTDSNTVKLISFHTSNKMLNKYKLHILFGLL